MTQRSLRPVGRGWSPAPFMHTSFVGDSGARLPPKRTRPVTVLPAHQSAMARNLQPMQRVPQSLAVPRTKAGGQVTVGPPAGTDHAFTLSDRARSHQRPRTLLVNARSLGQDARSLSVAQADSNSLGCTANSSAKERSRRAGRQLSSFRTAYAVLMCASMTVAACAWSPLRMVS